jgi:predicted transcriptional regulator
MSDHPEPNIRPTRASRAAIDQAAANIAKKLGYEPGADLKAFIEDRLGGKISIASPEKRMGEYGYLRVVPGTPEKFEIVLSPYTGEYHDRFTMAHELGHYFLHYLFQDRNDELIVNREGTSRAESEANWFAAGFLMPAEAFRAEWEASKGYLPLMIHRFRVASHLIARRHRMLEETPAPLETDGVRELA